MNHDRIFKELLTSFFYEFLELFFPALLASIDRSQPPTFLDKENFGELPGDLRREKDLVARVRLQSGDAYFIIRLEHEAQNNSDFPVRMFIYFSRLLERYGPPHRRFLQAVAQAATRGLLTPSPRLANARLWLPHTRIG